MYNQITIGHVKLPKSALNKGRYLKCVMEGSVVTVVKFSLLNRIGGLSYRLIAVF